MADSAESVAVESAASASTDAMIAVQAANAAENALVEIREAQTESTVEVAQAAVVLAETQAALVTAEAAAVISEAAHVIEQNEENLSWQENRIKALESSQSEVLSRLENLTLAVTELATLPADSSQLTPLNSEAVAIVATTENPPPVVEPAQIPEAPEAKSAVADDQREAAQKAAELAARRKRVLRFL